MAMTEKYVSSAGAGTHDGSSEANAFSYAEMITDINAGGKAGNRYNCDYDATYSRAGTTDTISGSGSSTSPIVIRGYLSAIGDGNLGRTNGNGALITTNMPLITYTTGRLSITGSWIILESLNFQAGTTSTAAVTLTANSAMVGCVVDDNSTGSCQIVAPGNNAVLFNCDLSLSGASGGNVGIFSNTANSRIVGNRIKGGPAIGVYLSGSGNVVAGNVIYRGTGAAAILIAGTGAPNHVLFNTIVNQGGASGDGINVVTGTTVLQCIIGNMVTDHGRYGINGVSAANAIFAAYNRLRDNASGNINSATDWLAATSYGHITSGNGTSDYTNAAGDNYSLIVTSPAKGAGWFPYADIGALQLPTPTVPAVADVRTGTQYGIGGTELTGTLSPVRTKTQFGT